ncbi:MAG: tetratricopeptide repeat protein [Aquabacterium sp.]|nr:tetratricopeptide repeat protein [Aquabacterium sp.]
MPRFPDFRLRARALACAVLWAATAAMAQPVDGALAALYADKNWTQALALIDRELARQPADAQLQIQRGVVLTNLNRSDDALAQFRKVVASHPELPGPHNNVAVLLAARGEFQEARLALERAIRTHPSYATAHENLGDLYSHMAAEAYRKALRYDKQGAAARPRLALVDGMPKTASPAIAAASVALAPRLPVVLPPPAPPAPVVVAAAPAGARPASTAAPSATATATTPATTPAAPSTTPPTTPTAVAGKATPAVPAAVAAVPPTASTAKPATVPAPAPAATVAAAATAARPGTAPASATAAAAAAAAAEAPNADERDIGRAVSAWAAAWSQRDMPAYYNAYTADFKGKAKSREEWKNDRKDRIEGKKRIDVTVQGLQIKVSGKLARVSLVQGYKSDSLSTTGPKVLVLENVGGKWLIQQENVGR